jgi:hypothetical protein
MKTRKYNRVEKSSVLYLVLNLDARIIPPEARATDNIKRR